MLRISTFELLLVGFILYVHAKLQKGELYLLTIELRDPNLHAIEFVLKDGSRERWLVSISLFILIFASSSHTHACTVIKCWHVFARLKLNHGNFRIEIPETDPTTLMPPIPKELIERNACLAWESKGRPVSLPQQEKVVPLLYYISFFLLNQKCFLPCWTLTKVYAFLYTITMHLYMDSPWIDRLQHVF